MVVVGGGAVAAVTRDDKERAGDGNGGVPCRMAGEIPDHLQNTRLPLKYRFLLFFFNCFAVVLISFFLLFGCFLEIYLEKEDGSRYFQFFKLNQKTKGIFTASIEFLTTYEIIILHIFIILKYLLRL